MIIELNSIPWCQDDPVPKEWPPMEPVRWVCAKFAAQCFVDESQHDQLFQLLHRATEWLHCYSNQCFCTVAIYASTIFLLTFRCRDSAIDSSCIAEVAALAESIAVHLRNEKNDPLECCRWYALIAQLASRHG